MARGERRAARSGPSPARCGSGARSGRCRARRRVRRCAHSSANVPTDSPGARMKVLATMSIVADLDVELEAVCAYRRCCAATMNGSGKSLCGSSAPTPVWIMASKRPSASRADRHPLLGERCARRRRGYTPSRESAMLTGRPASLRRRGREDLVLPQRLAAEAAADERRGHVDLLLLEAEDLGERPGHVRHGLRGVVDRSARRRSTRAVAACGSIALWLWRGVR